MPLIVTGLSLGGYVAILFTLWLQHVIDLKEAAASKDTKRPICITFGCPLVGDETLQQAIFELRAPTISHQIAHTSRSAPPSFAQNQAGTLFSKDQELVLTVLDAMESSRAGNTEIPDYGNYLKLIQRKALYRGVSESVEFNLDQLTWQLRQVGVQVPNNLIERMEEKRKRASRIKYSLFDPTKKLNNMKVSLAYVELYMKTRRSEGGYYDSHKNEQSCQVIVKHKGFLNQYWKEFVRKKNLLPQKEGAKLRKRWLYGGKNYRRIVEPLGIAEYYRDERKYYLSYRYNHYKLMEDWLIEDNKDQDPVGERKKAASLTEDSCFWTHVEEALILLTDLKNEGSSSSHADVCYQELEKFEAKVMGEIKRYSLSPDVFLEGNNLMKWWNEYEQHKGGSYVSEFSQYMNEVQIIPVSI